MDLTTLLLRSELFLRYVVDWEASLPTVELSSLIDDPRRAAVLCVDVINGFCHSGPLASDRVKSIIHPIVELFERAHAAGVRHFLLPQDTHEAEAVEFSHYPPHGMRGTEESDTVPELKALPFYRDMVIFPKNSINSALNTGLENWLKEHPAVDTFITVGDCTDLCTYQLAMFLRLRANAHQLRQRVILPVNCVDTFDLPVDTAKPIGAVPHDGDLLHLIFLYSMMLNGVEVVRSIA
jgi:nicotinamidase-related amidase